MTNSFIDELFVVPIFYTELETEILEETKKLVFQYIDSSEWKNLNHETVFQTKTTYHTHDDFLGKIGATKLINRIIESSDLFLENLGIASTRKLFLQSWLNVNPPNSFHHRHQHYGSILAGTFYIQVPENSGDFVIHDPIEARRMAGVYNNVQNFNRFNYEFYSYKQHPGRLMLFESWVPHTVKPNNSKEDRISISFNIRNQQ